MSGKDGKLARRRARGTVARSRSIQTSGAPRAAFSPMLLGRDVIFVEAVTIGRWQRERRHKDLPAMERQLIHARLSNGRTVVHPASIEYSDGERERLMDGIMDPQKALKNGMQGHDKIRARVFDRRNRATERVLGALAREYGDLPAAVHEETT